MAADWLSTGHTMAAMSEESPPHTPLPLRYRTPIAWAERALADPLALLDDHAHLEKKAGANALALLNRWPERQPPEKWVTTLTAVARDEAEHLHAVARLIHRRGGRISRSHRNPYAAALHDLIRKGGAGELVDRLLTSALIEARSCERFELLGRACAQRDEELAKLYRGLWASEHGHYRVFLELAEQVQRREEVDHRWDRMLEAEAEIIAHQEPGPRMHSGSGPPPSHP